MSRQYSQGAESPERRLRLEERKDLSELNMRLESYIFRVREREAELQDHGSEAIFMRTADHEVRISNVRAEYEDKLERLMEQYNRALVDVEELNRKLQREATKNEELQHTIRALEQARDDLQQRIAKLSHELDMQHSKYETDLGSIENLKKQIAALKRAEAEVAEELEETRQKNRDLEIEAARERDLKIAAQEDLKLAKASFEKERAALYARIEELTGTADEIEAEVRAQLNKQMQELVAKIQNEAQRAKDDVIRLQLEDFNAQLEELRDREAALIEERDELRVKFEKASATSYSNSKEKAENERKLRELEKRIHDLLDEIDATKTQHSRAIHVKNSEISKLLAKLKQVEDERNVLFGLGVGLKRAVETYEGLVHEEEVRMTKRQKISESVSSSPSKPVAVVAKKAVPGSTPSSSPKKGVLKSVAVKRKITEL